MATIKLKRGTSAPTTSNIVDGEVAVDLTSQKLYIRHDSGGSSTIKEIGTGVTGDATFAGSIFTTDLEVRGSGGGATNRLKATYNSSSGVAAFGPDSGGGSTSLQIGTSNSGTYSTALTLDSSQNATFAGDVSIPVGNKLYLGGGSHTYVSEDIDDRVRFFAGGTEFLRFTEDSSDITNLYTDMHIAGDVEFAGDIGLGMGGTSFGAGTPTINFKGTSLTYAARAGALRFRGNDDDDNVAALYVTDGSDGHGTVLCAYQGDIKFSTGSLTGAKLTVKSDGKVGIGTSSPGNIVEVSGASPVVEINSTSGNPELQFSDGGTDEFSMYYDTGANAFKFVEGGVGTKFTIADGGDATFAGNLDVDGSAGIYQRNSTGGSIVLDDTDTADGSTPMVYLRNTAGQLTLGRANRNATTGLTTGSTDSLTISSAGDATFAGHAELGGKLTVSTSIDGVGAPAAGTGVLGATAALGAILTGQGTTNDITISNDAGQSVLAVPTGTRDATFYGTVTSYSTSGDATFIAYRNQTTLPNTGDGSNLIGAYLFKSSDSNASPPHYAGIGGFSDQYGRMELQFFTERDNWDSDPRVPTLTLDRNKDATFVGNVTAGTILTINAPDGGGSPGMTATLNLHGYEGRGAGIKIKDSVNSASGASDREWFVGTGYNQNHFNIGYASDGSQSSYSAQSKLTIATSGNATFAGEVAATALDISGNVDIAGTLETDAFSINGTTVSATAAELNVLDPALKENYSIWIGSDPSGSTNSASYNSALGVGALDEITTGGYNTAVGFDAGEHISTGTQNTFIGAFAGEQFTEGDYNTSIGYNAGGGASVDGSGNPTSSTADSNTSVGHSALEAVTTGNQNVAIGKNAGLAITESKNNTLVGAYAADSLTTGDLNTAIGFKALETNTVGDRNTAVGYEALRYLNPSSNVDMYNTALGFKAGFDVNIGVQNTYIGTFSGEEATTGDGNVGVGYYSMGANAESTGDYNVGIGRYAAYSITTGSDNTIVGRNAGYDLTSGNANTLIGEHAGQNLTDSINNVAVGAHALNDATEGRFNVAVGVSALYENTVGERNVAIGNSALYNMKPNGSTEVDMDNVAVGYAAGYYTTLGRQNVFLGAYAGFKSASGWYNTHVGVNAGGGASANVATGDYNTSLGRNALANIEGSAAANTAVGFGALENMEDDSNNTAVGGAALQVLNGGASNVAVGYYAGQAVSSGDQNVYVGAYAGEEATTAEYNAVVGYSAGGGATASGSATTGNYNAVLGYKALEKPTTAGANITVGAFAMQSNLTGHNSVCVGYKAGQAITQGDANTLVGYTAGATATNLETGAYNTLVGAYCDTTATNSQKAVGIGYNLDCEAGYTTVGEGSNDARLAHGEEDWATVSDERYKKDIVDSSAGLNFINALRPRTFKYKTLGELPETFRAYEADSTEVFKNSKTNHGFIAQEVKAAIDADDSIKDGFKLWDDREDGSQELAQTALIPILVKAIQEQHALIEALTARIKKLEGE